MNRIYVAVVIVSFILGFVGRLCYDYYQRRKENEK